MLVDTVFIIININQWSNILRRTLEADISNKHIYKCLSKVLYKNMTMSKECDNSDLTGAPSTSGSSSSNWDNSCTNVNNSRFDQHLNEHESKAVNFNTNLALTTHPIVLQNVASNFYNLNLYQAGNFYYMGEYLTQSSNRYFCGTDREQHQISGIRQTSDQGLLSLRKSENVRSEVRSSRPGFIFTLMCYNVLAQDLLIQHPHLYNRHNPQSLQWSVRWNNIFNEISKLKPDLLCLQEVQDSHVNTFFSILETIGYSHLYKRRTGVRTDGCALYYKTDKIELVEHTSVEFYQPNISILDRDNVGLIAKFAPKLHPTREFVVATTHLLYNPKRQDVRLAQMQVLLTEIERISYHTKSDCNYVPVILTGDLNSTPDSSVYELITKGKLEYEHLSPKSLMKDANASTGKLLIPAELRITDNCQHADLLEERISCQMKSRTDETCMIELFHSERVVKKQCKKREINSQLFSTGTLSHNFAFKSVYNHGIPENNECTTFQEQWITVDYIFYSTKKDNIYSEDKLKLLTRYRLPNKEELKGINIPNSVVGSDHLSLFAKFKLEY